jgi:hypothetical protein
VDQEPSVPTVRVTRSSISIRIPGPATGLRRICSSKAASAAGRSTAASEHGAPAGAIELSDPGAMVRGMKLLTATRERQGDEDGDFCFAIEGELVLLGLVCATDQRDPGGGCGCGRAFSGMSSMRATTTALVRDLDISFDDARLAVEGYVVSAGMGADVIGGQEFTQLVAETLVGMAEIAEPLPVGAVVGRRLDQLVRRPEPSEIGER